MLEQEKLIEVVKEKGRANPHMEAIWMYGSFTQGGGDAYSDVEFYLYLREQVRQRVQSQMERLAAPL